MEAETESEQPRHMYMVSATQSRCPEWSAARELTSDLTQCDVDDTWRHAWLIWGTLTSVHILALFAVLNTKTVSGRARHGEQDTQKAWVL